MLNPITYTEQVVSDFLKYQLSTYAFADQSLYAQMRELLNLEQTRATPLLKGPYISLSRTFQQGASLADLAKEGMLHAHIQQLSPYPSAYGHQEKAFRAIHAGKTTLVATGTGSGKTECFLFPIVSRCLALRDSDETEGVTAVIVYPMNALAEDQLMRMRELLAGTGISFGMYVGKTPKRSADAPGVRLKPGSSQADYLAKVQELRNLGEDRPVHPYEERVSREEMRETGKQPRILLTNVKQLELLLTRQHDLELFDNARLEFMVFDEAHTFTGAQGAETACLIRRLRAYCGKDEASTTCIATSATIADPVVGLEAGREFASRFFGVDGSQVELIGEAYEADTWGSLRSTSPAPHGDATQQLKTLLEILSKIDVENPDQHEVDNLRYWFQGATGSPLAGSSWREDLYTWLSHNEVVYQIAESLQKPRALADLLEELAAKLNRVISEEEILIWLALGAASRQSSRPLLRPVVHGFVRGVGGAVVTFPEANRKTRLWLSADEALREDDTVHRVPVLSCNTCGQHYFEHTLEDFSATGQELGGGQAEGDNRIWRHMEISNGGYRAISLNHLVGDEDNNHPAMARRTVAVYLCRYCGTAHGKDTAQCLGCGRDKPLALLFMVRQHEDHQGHIHRCVSCDAMGRRFVGQYREPARPVRATTVADVHVLAQSMIHRAERRRLLVFADNRQDAAFQAGWMQDHSRRFRFRELMFQKIREGAISVGDLTAWLDSHLDADNELSRALIPEVWRVARKEAAGFDHQNERKRFLRIQILRELVMGARQRIGLEPWGRMRPEYLGLTHEHTTLLKWANHIGCKAQALMDGVASLLDAARSRKTVYDAEGEIFSKFWMEGEREISRGYLPLMQDVPSGLKLTRDGDDDKNRINQWYSRYDSGAKQAAKAWGVAEDEVEQFLNDIWVLLTKELKLLVPVTLKGARGKALPRCSGAHQVDTDKLLMTPHKGYFQCGTCRRVHIRNNPANRCMAWRCEGDLVWQEENPDNYDLLMLDQKFAMLRAREHSAQIPGLEREKIEIAFKTDGERINTLVCTPTLEMGVNIGALDAVLMRNVPPKPANYWQRAGRAGREFRMALDITYARPASHDRAYFVNPLKMLEGRVDPPSFNLKNNVMVRKHVHATVLTSLFQMFRAQALPQTDLDQLENVLSHCFPPIIKGYLFAVDGAVRREPLDVSVLSTLVAKYKAELLAKVLAAFQQGWPVADRDVVDPVKIETIIDNVGSRLSDVISRLFSRLQWALGQLKRLQKISATRGSLEIDEEALRYRCERLVKKLKGERSRRRSEAEGFDDTNTYGVLAAEGFLPGYGLDTGAVTITHEAPRFATDIKDWELRRGTALALREYIPGNLVYANSHKFVPRRFHLEADEPLTFEVDIASESVQEVGSGFDMPVSMGASRLQGVAMCDVDAPHQSFISDEEDYRFQMGVAIFGHEQGRHAEGKAYEWGNQALHLRKGVHLRLLNTGPAARVRNQGVLGYPVCTVCGQSRSPLGAQAEIDSFIEHHTERCGRPVEPIAFYADIVSDAINLPNCASKEQAYSVLEAVRHGAAEVLDMELSDLQLLTLGQSGSDQVDALLYDPMPGGSGLLDQLILRWDEVITAAIAIAEGCESACETSCIDCLQNFRNAFYHENLNRHTALECLHDWGSTLVGSHVIAPVLPDSTQTKQPVNDPEATLKAMLEAAGLTNFETEKPIRLSDGKDTRPDVYFHEPNELYAGVCIYLDGMSEHIHGNPKSAAKDRLIRNELRNTEYEVIEIMHQQLFDREMMRGHMRRIGRAVMGRKKAKELEANDAWFEVHDKPQIDEGQVSSEVQLISTNNPNFKPYKNCVPLTSLKAAAGSWSEEQDGLESLAENADEWIVVDDQPLQRGMFVAQVVGHSMEPLVPSGSYCLFRPVPAGTREGRKLLVWHAGITDDESGGQYTLKVYHSEKSANDDSEWQHKKIVLKPINPNYKAIELMPTEEGEIRVIAEMLSVISHE